LFRDEDEEEQEAAEVGLKSAVYVKGGDRGAALA